MTAHTSGGKNKKRSLCIEISRALGYVSIHMKTARSGVLQRAVRTHATPSPVCVSTGASAYVMVPVRVQKHLSSFSQAIGPLFVLLETKKNGVYEHFRNGSPPAFFPSLSPSLLSLSYKQAAGPTGSESSRSVFGASGLSGVGRYF